MAINLSNVNISLNEFQRLSIGEHNAGEVKLASASTGRPPSRSTAPSPPPR